MSAELLRAPLWTAGAGPLGPFGAVPRARVLTSMEVGVVGAGASAVCLLDALAQTDSPVGRITVFDPTPGPWWRGRPYRDDEEQLRVNAVPADMSVRAYDPGHFARWLRRDPYPAVEDPAIGTPFVPRAVYGRYLADSAADAIERLRRRGWYVGLERTAVTAVVRTEERVVLRTAQGRHHAVDYVALCVGVGSPDDLYGLHGTPGYLADPYPVRETVARLDPRADVAVLGSGLTAIDVALSLAVRGHQGRIVLASRNGVLPGVRQRPVELELAHFTAQRFRRWAAEGRRTDLDTLVELMRRELAATGAADVAALAAEVLSTRREPAADRLRRHLSEVDSPDLGLRVLQRAVPDTGPDVWPLLPRADRDRILTHHYRTLMSLCCPMPPSTAAALLELADTGRLEFRPGLEAVRPAPGGRFELVTTAGEVRTDQLVNGVSPPGHRIPPRARRLTESLLRAGRAERHRHGGLAVERATSRLTTGGVGDPRLYALGDLAAGSLFFTFGIPSLVDRAVDITAAMVAHAEATGRTSPRVLALR